MAMWRTLAGVAVAASLAACAPEAEDNTDGQAPAPRAEASAPAEPAPSPEPLPLAEIPQSFRGVWDYVAGTCAPESDLRIDIGPKTIGFYESIGDVERVERIDARNVVVFLAMEGEGERWEDRLHLTLSQDGAILEPSGDGDRGAPMPRKRCPAEQEDTA